MAHILGFMAKWGAILGIVILLVYYLPSFVYFLFSPNSDISRLIASSFTKTQSQGQRVANDSSIRREQFLPRFDASLPMENMLIIPSVGIKTKINEATQDNYEEALKKGVWRVSDYGAPSESNVPTILAAHRYGYLKWSVSYRLKNSFYNLPKLEVGDTVEIVWRQRKYVYIVYAQEKGEEIADYSADLILYTCESLSSPIRVFKYARLLEV
jgi:sortase (surface protein transpeptidase)